MGLDFTKEANGDEVAPLGSVGVLEVELEWEQPQTGGGFMGKLKGLRDATDVDVAGILFEGDEPVDYVDPKQHPSALGGAVVHHGDVKRGAGEGGGERITMRLADIRETDSVVSAGWRSRCSPCTCAPVGPSMPNFPSRTKIAREWRSQSAFLREGWLTDARYVLRAADAAVDPQPKEQP